MFNCQVPTEINCDHVMQLVKLYGEARLNLFSQQLATVQDQVRVQGLILLPLWWDYNAAQQSVKQAWESYQHLNPQALAVCPLLDITANDL